MKAQTLTPFQLFGNQVRYVVPLFQRPYVWNRGDQWEPLWNDIRMVADRLLEAENASDDVPPHFLGAIVLDQQLVPAAYIAVRHIIDGQQRLTTLQLLLDAAQWVIHRHGHAVDASALENVVLNNAAVAPNAEDVFKVWPTNHDRPVFRAVMSNDQEIALEDAKSPIAQAHRFFVEVIEEWAEVTGDPDKAARRLNVLAMSLTQYLKLVVIDLEPGDNAQVIFETLNHRGTPLLAADLVKNLVFQGAQAQGADLEQLYEERWARFDDPKAWRGKVKQGRLYRPRIDVLLNYWLVMRTRREVASDRVFTEFRDYLRASGNELLKVVDDLARNADVYDRLESSPPGSFDGTFNYRVLQVMEQYVWGPLLLWLYSWDEATLPESQRRAALSAIESWSVRRMLCRMAGKDTNRLMLDVLERLDDDNVGTAGDVVEAFLGQQTAENRLWPTDQMVRGALEVQPLYTGITRARLRMVLEALEDRLRTPMSEEAHCPKGTLTIEHVMPQGWREHWPLDPGDTEELAGPRRDRIVHTLGNLTLVNGKLNPALSNRPWTDSTAAERGLGSKGKHSLMKEHIVLHLNKRIVNGWPDEWTEAAIAARRKELTETVLAVWPRPDATVADGDSPPAEADV